MARAWFDATCRYPEEVDEAMFSANADRAEAQVKAKFGIK